LEIQEYILEIISESGNRYDEIKYKVKSKYKIGNTKFSNIMKELVEKNYLEKIKIARTHTVYKKFEHKTNLDKFEFTEITRRLDSIIKQNKDNHKEVKNYDKGTVKKIINQNKRLIEY